MMRLRRASIIVVLNLLASVRPAHADCAWVAWLSSMHKSGLTDITPIGASDSKAECQQRIASVQQGFEAMTERNLVAFSVICLPDTVDPRGPKGK